MKSPKCHLKWSGSLGASLFPEAKYVKFVLRFENKKDSKMVCSALPGKSNPPEPGEGPLIPSGIGAGVLGKRKEDWHVADRVTLRTLSQSV